MFLKREMLYVYKHCNHISICNVITGTPGLLVVTTLNICSFKLDSQSTYYISCSYSLILQIKNHNILFGWTFHYSYYNTLWCFVLLIILHSIEWFCCSYYKLYIFILLIITHLCTFIIVYFFSCNIIFNITCVFLFNRL